MYQHREMTHVLVEFSSEEEDLYSSQISSGSAEELKVQMEKWACENISELILGLDGEDLKFESFDHFLMCTIKDRCFCDSIEIRGVVDKPFYYRKLDSATISDEFHLDVSHDEVRIKYTDCNGRLRRYLYVIHEVPKEKTQPCVT